MQGVTSRTYCDCRSVAEEAHWGSIRSWTYLQIYSVVVCAELHAHVPEIWQYLSTGRVRSVAIRCEPSPPSAHGERAPMWMRRVSSPFLLFLVAVVMRQPQVF